MKNKLNQKTIKTNNFRLNKRTVEISDLQIATVLESSGVNLIKIIKPPGSTRAIFVFQDPDNNIEQIINDFFDRKLLVEPKKLFESQKALKQRLMAM